MNSYSGEEDKRPVTTEILQEREERGKEKRRFISLRGCDSGGGRWGRGTVFFV